MTFVYFQSLFVPTANDGFLRHDRAGTCQGDASRGAGKANDSRIRIPLGSSINEGANFGAKQPVATPANDNGSSGNSEAASTFSFRASIELEHVAQIGTLVVPLQEARFSLGHNPATATEFIAEHALVGRSGAEQRGFVESIASSVSLRVLVVDQHSDDGEATEATAASGTLANPVDKSKSGPTARSRGSRVLHEKIEQSANRQQSSGHCRIENGPGFYSHRGGANGN